MKYTLFSSYHQEKAMEEIQTYCQIKNKNKVNDIDSTPVGVPIV
jgi:hypothetical protein